MNSNSRTSRNGFTLIEVVVSITIMAMICVVVLSALRTGFSFWDKGTNHLEKLRRSRVVMDVLTDQIRGALPFSYVNRTSQRPVTQIAFEGDNRGVRFASRTSFKDGPNGVPRWVEVRWVPDAQHTGGQLVAEEHRILSPDNVPDQAVYWRGSVLDAVDCSFDFLKRGQAAEAAKWMAAWRYPEAQTLPDAIRIRCVSQSHKMTSLFPLDYAESSAAGLVLQ